MLAYTNISTAYKYQSKQKQQQIWKDIIQILSFWIVYFSFRYKFLCVERYELRYMQRRIMESIKLNELLVYNICQEKNFLSFVSNVFAIKWNNVLAEGWKYASYITWEIFVIAWWHTNWFASNNIEINLWQLCSMFAVDIMLTWNIYWEKHNNINSTDNDIGWSDRTIEAIYSCWKFGWNRYLLKNIFMKIFASN